MNISNIDSRVQAPTPGCKHPPTGASTHPRVQAPTHGCKHPPTGASTHTRVQASTHGCKHPPTGASTHTWVQAPTHGCKHPPKGANTHTRVQAPTHGFTPLSVEIPRVPLVYYTNTPASVCVSVCLCVYVSHIFSKMAEPILMKF